MDTDLKDWTNMKIALLGYGTVGRGVDKIIGERVDDVEVSRILELPDRLSDPRMTSEYEDIVSDPEIGIVVECMGGIEPAHAFIMRALEAGKHVVTSNKAVVAAHFAEFAACALEHGVSLFIEASVGGGIPWIAGIEKARRVDEVTSFSGIMNGTTNYIVYAMLKDGADFGEVLAEAQSLGYAERDPSADIDGLDVKNKTVITASVAFDVACEKDIPVSASATSPRPTWTSLASAASQSSFWAAASSRRPLRRGRRARSPCRWSLWRPTSPATSTL